MGETEARKKYQIEWEKNNRHRRAERRRNWYHENKEKEQEYAKNYYQKNSERLIRTSSARQKSMDQDERRKIQRTWKRKHRLENPEKYIVMAARTRAKQKGREFTINEDHIVIPSHCPILGIPLNWGNGRDNMDSSPSLDRIDNDRGYTPENVRIISFRANVLKADMSIKEAHMLVRNWYNK